MRIVGRERRKLRIRKKISGTSERPRLSVFRSGNHIYAQVIDDAEGKTLAAASTVGKAKAGTSVGAAGSGHGSAPSSTSATRAKVAASRANQPQVSKLGARSSAPFGTVST